MVSLLLFLFVSERALAVVRDVQVPVFVPKLFVDDLDGLCAWHHDRIPHKEEDGRFRPEFYPFSDHKHELGKRKVVGDEKLLPVDGRERFLRFGTTEDDGDPFGVLGPNPLGLVATALEVVSFLEIVHGVIKGSGSAKFFWVDERSFFFPDENIFFAPGHANDCRWREEKKCGGWRKKNNMWRDTVANEASSTTGEIRRILSGGESHQATKGGLVFVATVLITYLLLAMVRPRVVVYKRGDEEVPRFRAGAAMLWAAAAGAVGVGLCFVDR